MRGVVLAVAVACGAGMAAADGLPAPPPGLAAVGADVAATALAALIREGAAEAAAGARPLDASMRARVAGVVPEAVIDRVRWTVAAPGSRLRAALFAEGAAGVVDAVTLGDVVVFRDMGAAGDVALMAHELVHVAQYGRWGVDGFARRYVTDAAGVEAEARAVARGWAASQTSPRPVPRPAR